MLIPHSKTTWIQVTNLCPLSGQGCLGWRRFGCRSSGLGRWFSLILTRSCILFSSSLVVCGSCAPRVAFCRHSTLRHPAHLAFNGALVSGGFGVWGGQRPDFETHKSSRRLTGPVASKAFLLAVISTRPLTESLGPAASCAFHSAIGLTDHWQESLGPAAFRASRSAFILTRIRMMSIGLATF